ncbi:MAG: glutathione S-transferase [Oceanospirillaceae bacterium]|uniref:glutathione S-transferase family protein n=1 Tax=Thalassolituus sp. UBA3500 TaxID=1947664 RepID=UPI000C0D740E|nr:glutathione S-transferase family protein [Thalassolituus sp. UBA3500]MAE34288.1 glutathione S-transferase [Oceanospirillaceae bacterium]MBN57576.1 glutathione S-transferase [Oceanospirillaceae bacterium]|tara:strand:- start:1701 stop:2309 length:609 start_codon:yes stop_codon:yes gene_type:complete
MKLYDNPHAPNPRRVRMVLAEKGIAYDREELDLGAGDNLKVEFCAKNPFAKVPVLELDDGLCLSETPAICRYLDEISDEGSLFGKTPKERAIIDMWEHRMESMVLYPAMFAFQHITGFFKDRMTPVEEFGKESAKNFLKALPVLEAQLENNDWIAGSQFSIADITAVCAIDFARIVKVRVGDEYPNIQRWYAAMKERPSYAA